MGLYEQFPYVNFHGVNLKWILDRMVEFETRLTTAESDIADLKTRMTAAENDIDALEDRMDTAEDDIEALEGRMDTAEDDIDALQLLTPVYIDLDAGNLPTTPPDPQPYKDLIYDGHPVYLRYIGTNGRTMLRCFSCYGQKGASLTRLWFYDMNGEVSGSLATAMGETAPESPSYIGILKRTNGTIDRWFLGSWS